MFGKDKAPRSQPPKPAAANPARAALTGGPGGDRAGGAPSIISADMKVVGNLHSGGDIQIDGTVEGDIHSRTLTVGENAHIDGSISAESVNISGRVSGQVKAAAVRIAKTANVQGDITYKTLAIEEEAVLDGQLRRMDTVKPVTAEAKPGAVKPEAAAASKPGADVASLKAAQVSGSGGGEAKTASAGTRGAAAPAGPAAGGGPSSGAKPGAGGPGGKPLAR